MISRSELRTKIFEQDEQSFNETAIKLFRYQYLNNETYRQFCSLLNVQSEEVQSIDRIPFLPIEIFKTHKVVTGNLSIEKIFLSSGTTGEQASKHFIHDLALYEESFLRSFEKFFGHANQYCILALLPSYLERTDSSLVYMTETLIKKTGHRKSGFFLHNLDDLYATLKELEAQQQKSILIGVTFALLDFAEKFPMHLKKTLVLETGGMKGRREEMTREELHKTLRERFGVEQIYSEYGMTELLSQAYLMEDEKFHCPEWMKIIIRDVNDPMQMTGSNTTGGINVIDFSNLDSCCFIATADLGKSYDDGSFDVLGRMDYSDVRGCSLMWE